MGIDLKKRTFEFSLAIIDLAEQLPKNKITDVVTYQMVKSGTSVGANYRAAKRARSDREFISKMNIVLEESDETSFWLEIIDAKSWIKNNLLKRLLKESDELTAIFVSTLKTVNSRLHTNK